MASKKGTMTPEDIQRLSTMHYLKPEELRSVLGEEQCREISETVQLLRRLELVRLEVEKLLSKKPKLRITQATSNSDQSNDKWTGYSKETIKKMYDIANNYVSEKAIREAVKRVFLLQN